MLADGAPVDNFAGKHGGERGVLEDAETELVDHDSGGSGIERLVARSHRLEALRRRKALVPLDGYAVCQVQPVDIARLESALDAGVIRGSNCRRVEVILPAAICPVAWSFETTRVWPAAFSAIVDSFVVCCRPFAIERQRVSQMCGYARSSTPASTTAIHPSLSSLQVK